jgi:hypothetical protein
MINQSLDTSIQEIFNLEEKYMNQVTRIVATQELTENIKPTPQTDVTYSRMNYTNGKAGARQLKEEDVIQSSQETNQINS